MNSGVMNDHGHQNEENVESKGQRSGAGARERGINRNCK